MFLWCIAIIVKAILKHIIFHNSANNASCLILKASPETRIVFVVQNSNRNLWCGKPVVNKLLPTDGQPLYVDNLFTRKHSITMEIAAIKTSNFNLRKATNAIFYCMSPSASDDDILVMPRDKQSFLFPKLWDVLWNESIWFKTLSEHGNVSMLVCRNNGQSDHLAAETLECRTIQETPCKINSNV